MTGSWRPTASRATLEKRATLLARARRFFQDGGVLEVDTPMVVNAPVTDVHIHSARVDLCAPVPAGRQSERVADPPPSFFLHTSPEYAMKRLLAAGSGDIYQICHVVRGLERGRLHNAEFTLIEWYRLGFTLDDLMSEVDALVRALLGPVATAHTSERLTYREVFLRELQLDPLSATLSELQTAADKLGFTANTPPSSNPPSETPPAGTSPPGTPSSGTSPEGTSPRGTSSSGTALSETAPPGSHPSETAPSGATNTAAPTIHRDELLDFLMGAIIGPRLGRNALTFVHAYPASQAALARLDPQDPRTAQRFELYCEGVELANGFHELSSPAEQRTRFTHDLNERRRLGLPTHPPDEFLLAALEAGLPDCSGVALGFDRTLMLATGSQTIDEVLPFPTERA